MNQEMDKCYDKMKNVQNKVYYHWIIKLEVYEMLGNKKKNFTAAILEKVARSSYSVYPCPKFAYEQHTHEFQISNVICVFSYSSVQIVYCIFLSSTQWKWVD